MLAGAEARQCTGDDILARQPDEIHRLAGDDQRLGGIEPARDADDGSLHAGRRQPLRQPGDLNVVGLVAILGEPLRI
jgi:hypothetical protein